MPAARRGLATPAATLAVAAAALAALPGPAAAVWHSGNHPAADNVLAVCRNGIHVQVFSDRADGAPVVWDQVEFASPAPAPGAEPPAANVVGRPDLTLDYVPDGVVTDVDGDRLPDLGSFPLDLRHNFGEFILFWTRPDGSRRELAPGATVQLDWFDGDPTSTAPVVSVRDCRLPTPPRPDWGYAWAQDPAPPAAERAYLAAADYARTSGGIRPVVTRPGTGRYLVRLPGAGDDGGVAHVTRYGDAALACAVDGWYPAGADQMVSVSCADTAGSPADSRFVVGFGAPVRGTALAQLWANLPSARSYTPAPDYQWTSAGTLATISRTGVGAYSVRLPGLGGAAGGVALVTPYAAAGSTCSVSGTTTTSAAVTVGVRCFAPSGAAADRQFSLSFLRRQGWLDGPRRSAYVVADRPTVASYLPVNRYNSTGGTNEVRRLDVGRYDVRLPGLTAYGGSVQVTAYGSLSARCGVVGWGPNSGAQSVTVACAGAGGSPLDTAFGLAYTG